MRPSGRALLFYYDQTEWGETPVAEGQQNNGGATGEH